MWIFCICRQSVSFMRQAEFASAIPTEPISCSSEGLDALKSEVEFLLL